jgi:hypothetical protein
VNLRHPVNSVTASVYDAVNTRLNGVPSDLATKLLGEQDGKPRSRRPQEAECAVAAFVQSRRGLELAYRHIESETVVITGPMQDACVYFAGQFLYHIQSPNRQFFLDLAAQWMEGPSGALRYEGGDSEVVQSLPYELEMVMARAQAAFSSAKPEQAELIVTLLRDLTTQFERVASNHGNG